MKIQGFGYTLAFMAFFAIGTSAFILAILAGELRDYYAGRSDLEKAEQKIKDLELLNSDYDAAMEHLENDPEVIERLAAPTLGKEPEREDTAYPKAGPKFLALAKQAGEEKEDSSGVPVWLERCNDPVLKKLLLGSGVCLILISFVCFRLRKTAK